MNDVLAGVCLLVGSGFCLLASYGLHKMPDFYCRMQATTKGTTLGVGLVLLGLALHAGGGAIATKALAVIVFLFITSPAGAHMIARAAYMARIPQWSGAKGDALAGVYDTFLEPPDPQESAESDEMSTDSHANVREDTRNPA